MFYEFRKNSPAFGLDLSDNSFKVVQLGKKRDRVFIDSFFKGEIPFGLIEGGEIKKEKELVNLFKKTFKEIRGNSFQGRRVVCSLPEEKVFIRIIQLPFMKNEELDEAVKWEAEANIPLDIDEVYLGWQIIKPIFSHVDHIDVLIVATPKNLVNGYVSFLKKSGFKPVALEPESVAVVRSLMKDDDLKPTIIVDLGATGTNFVIFSALAIRFTSHIPISGNLFNQSIMKELGVDEKKAIELKIKVGLDRTSMIDKEGKVYNALNPVIDNLAKQIRDYIKFYHEHSAHIHGPDGAIGQVVLCGGDSLLINISDVFSKKLELPVKIGDSLINVNLSDKKNQLKMSKKESLIYTTALGLALRDLE
ncbi:type IV pilus assembly protein PilM [Patescibacteria group bacterium]|nr:type IV pilus assembly protein PilM [Patescibacteria group bacterium]MBU2472628.1 type IV pilus assembly protein PilM [Patescibacteria group bacterium]